MQQIRLLFAAIVEDEERFFRRWERILGTYWEYHDLHSTGWDEHSGQPATYLRMPLAAIMAPDFMKHLRKTELQPPGGKVTKPGSDRVEMADLDKKAYTELMQGALTAASQMRGRKAAPTVPDPPPVPAPTKQPPPIVVPRPPPRRRR